MKLTTFKIKKNSEIHFGLIVEGKVIAFNVLQDKAGKVYSGLKDIYGYLENLPQSERIAKELSDYAQKNKKELGNSFLSFEEISFLSPIPKPSALLDFTLSPQHLKNSVKTLIEHEFKGFKQFFMKRFMMNKMKSKTTVEQLPYYKGNHNAIIGDGEVTEWPDYSAYLDFEPELAFVYGNKKQPIAGYLIFNDWSVRDVQWPELFQVSLTRSKDFNRSNGLGPFLVTCDEVENPLDLKVHAKVGERIHWEGSTSEYSHHPKEVVRYVESVFSPKSGTVVGLGTIPGCCGLDRNEWIQPGEEIAITIDSLGTLRQRAPSKVLDFNNSRWGSHY